jgi:hypothetical protein
MQGKYIFDIMSLKAREENKKLNISKIIFLTKQNEDNILQVSFTAALFEGCQWPTAVFSATAGIFSLGSSFPLIFLVTFSQKHWRKFSAAVFTTTKF